MIVIASVVDIEQMEDIFRHFLVAYLELSRIISN